MISRILQTRARTLADLYCDVTIDTSVDVTCTNSHPVAGLSLETIYLSKWGARAVCALAWI